MNRIDACGMSCPQPVLMTKKAIETTPDELEILVDNNTAKINVGKFLKSRGYSFTVTEEENFLLKAVKK